VVKYVKRQPGTTRGAHESEQAFVLRMQRRLLIDAAPRRVEVRDGREWTVVELPSGVPVVAEENELARR